MPNSGETHRSGPCTAQERGARTKTQEFGPPRDARHPPPRPTPAPDTRPTRPDEPRPDSVGEGDEAGEVLAREADPRTRGVDQEPGETGVADECLGELLVLQRHRLIAASESE